MPIRKGDVDPATWAKLTGEPDPAPKAREPKPTLVEASHEPWSGVWVVPLHVTAGDNRRGCRDKIGRAGHERRVVSKHLGGVSLCELAAFAWLASRGQAVTVTLTRLGGRSLDDDNAVAAMKYVRDGVALMLGFDDGPDSPLRFVVRQETGGESGVKIQLDASPILDDAGGDDTIRGRERTRDEAGCDARRPISYPPLD